MRNGQILVKMTGNRLPTSYRCNACSEQAGHAVWHDTHRGMSPEPCPLQDAPPTRSAAVIEKHKLGTFGTKRPKRQIHLNMRDIMPAVIPGID